MKHVTRAAALLFAAALGATSLTAQVPAVSKGDIAMPDRTNAEKLRTAMRKLWTDHVVWTRAYIVGVVADDPSASEAAKRLMKNQEEMGAAIVPYYGKEAGDKLTDLLKQHINIAVDLVAAAKAKDDAKVKDADTRWHTNARDLATFLSGANPNWKMDDLVNMLNEHLDLTTKEATYRLEKDWEDDVATFDRILDQALHMADTLADGIIKQFPTK
jgi:hypothetical protein